MYPVLYLVIRVEPEDRKAGNCLKISQFLCVPPERHFSAVLLLKTRYVLMFSLYSSVVGTNSFFFFFLFSLWPEVKGRMMKGREV